MRDDNSINIDPVILDSFHSQRPQQSELTAGGMKDHFLIAMPNLRDPVFSHSITYICDHSAQGALGIVINHPLNIHVADIFSQLKLATNALIAGDLVLSGGPVHLDRGFVLHPTGWQYESTLQISPNVCLTASKDVLIDLAAGSGPIHALVALGYAGWSAGQLEAEIAQNSWLTVPADPHVMFNTPCEQRWAAASKYLGIDLNLIHSTAGHA